MDILDSERLAVLWTKAQPVVAAFIRTMVRDAGDSEELLQRTAVVLVRRFPLYDASRPFAAWAIGMAKYEVLQYRRIRASERHRFDDELVEAIADGYQRSSITTAPQQEALEACLEELDGRGRQVIDLCYGEGLAADAIAENMNLSAGAVRTLLYRVRGLLRQCIERRMLQHGGSSS